MLTHYWTPSSHWSLTAIMNPSKGSRTLRPTPIDVSKIGKLDLKQMDLKLFELTRDEINFEAD